MQSNILAARTASDSESGSETTFRPAPQGDADSSAGAQIASALAENRELKAELDQLRAERTDWRETQGRIMQLLGSSSADKLVHDLRNVLNERDLLKALVDEL
jgi:hypothetical protein